MRSRIEGVSPWRQPIFSRPCYRSPSTTRSCARRLFGLRHPATGWCDAAGGGVAVMVPDPVAQVAAVFIAALRDDVEQPVGAEQILAAAPERGIGVIDRAGLVLVENAAAGQLVDPHLARLIIVVGLAAL